MENLKSMDYIDEILKFTTKKELLDILDYIGYIASDNGEYDTRDFLETLKDEIDN